MTEWHSLDLEKVFKKLNSSKNGLSREEAESRLEEFGRNEIEQDSRINPLKIFFRQFADFLIIILIAAAIISYLMSFFPGQEGHIFDSILIAVILFANAIIGFVQEYRAEKGILALRKMSAPRARVIRNGTEKEIDSKELVPGDIILLEQGDKIMADAVLIEESNLETNESTLTGESQPVAKKIGQTKEKTPLAERKNMVYRNTIVTRGRGKAIVTSTGMNTEVGKIAEQIASAPEKRTTFQIELDKLGKRIGAGILAIIALVAVIHLALVGGSVVTVFLTSISLAVAAVPEGLPAIVTLALTIGVKKMAKRNALIRRLPVAESLGSVNTICTDKTGTLTENAMTVRKAFFNQNELRISGEGYSSSGGFFSNEKRVSQERVKKLLECGALCNNARIGSNEQGEKKYFGDPTETALLVSAEKAGFDIKKEKKKNSFVKEIPFSSERKMMTVIRESNGKKTAYSKGAPEIILEKCSHYYLNGEKKKLTPEKREEILNKNTEWGKQALRVLGFAFREITGKEKEKNIEKNLVFLGLQGMIDPPRKGVLEAITECRKAGIKVIMVTGDNINTAKAIGKELGFSEKNALTGRELEEISSKELAKKLESTEIFARVSPSHKVKILKALQHKGKIVGMTGDGVNDAPAVKRANVGISMGIRGTDVTKETSDLILLDDNFVTIRHAVAEGRGIFDNIRKFVNYLLSSNVAEVLVVFIFTLLAVQFYFGRGAVILTAAQLLWINMLTDGLPAVALGLDPKAEGIMKRNPRKKSEGIIDNRMIYSILTIGIAMSAVILGVFLFYFFSSSLALTQRFAIGRTMAFTCFVVFEMVRVQTVRAYFKTKIFSNKWLWMAVAGSFALQLLVLYTPLNSFFRVVPLTLSHWELIGVGTLLFIALSILITKIEGKLFGRME